jgi:hypothetical protein
VGQSPPQALAMANTTRFTARNIATEALPAIATEYSTERRTCLITSAKQSD